MQPIETTVIQTGTIQSGTIQSGTRNGRGVAPAHRAFRPLQSGTDYIDSLRGRNLECVGKLK